MSVGARKISDVFLPLRISKRFYNFQCQITYGNIGGCSTHVDFAGDTLPVGPPERAGSFQTLTTLLNSQQPSIYSTPLPKVYRLALHTHCDHFSLDPRTQSLFIIIDTQTRYNYRVCSLQYIIEKQRSSRLVFFLICSNRSNKYFQFFFSA